MPIYILSVHVRCFVNTCHAGCFERVSNLYVRLTKHASARRANASDTTAHDVEMTDCLRPNADEKEFPLVYKAQKALLHHMSTPGQSSQGTAHLLGWIKPDGRQNGKIQLFLNAGSMVKSNTQQLSLNRESTNERAAHIIDKLGDATPAPAHSDPPPRPRPQPQAPTPPFPLTIYGAPVVGSPPSDNGGSEDGSVDGSPLSDNGGSVKNIGIKRKLDSAEGVKTAVTAAPAPAFFIDKLKFIKLSFGFAPDTKAETAIAKAETELCIPPEAREGNPATRLENIVAALTLPT